MRVPPASSISIIDPVMAGAESDTIATGEKLVEAAAGVHNCCRQRNSWLVWIPAARPTSEATARAQAPPRRSAPSRLAAIAAAAAPM